MATDSSMFFRFSCRSNASSFSGRKKGDGQVVWAHLPLSPASAYPTSGYTTLLSAEVFPPSCLLIHKNDRPPRSAQIWLQILAQKSPNPQCCSTISFQM